MTTENINEALENSELDELELDAVAGGTTSGHLKSIRSLLAAAKCPYIKSGRTCSGSFRLNLKDQDKGAYILVRAECKKCGKTSQFKYVKATNTLSFQKIVD